MKSEGGIARLAELADSTDDELKKLFIAATKKVAS